MRRAARTAVACYKIRLDLILNPKADVTNTRRSGSKHDTRAVQDTRPRVIFRPFTAQSCTVKLKNHREKRKKKNTVGRSVRLTG